jgi:hypothetical protein
MQLTLRIEDSRADMGFDAILVFAVLTLIACFIAQHNPTLSRGDW